MTELVEPAIEATSTSQQSEVSGTHATDKGKVVYISNLKKKFAPSTKPKRIVIGAFVAPDALISKEVEPISRGDDIVPPPAGVLVGELTKKEQLDLALKASMDTA